MSTAAVVDGRRPRVTALAVVGCSGQPPLKAVMKRVAPDRYAASVREDDERVKLAGHLPFSPENVARFERHNIWAALIVRDPRDNLLQLIRRSERDYCVDKFERPRTHPTAVAYHRLVMAAEERGDQGLVEFYVDGIGGRQVLEEIFRVAAWNGHPRVHTVRFEDLVDLHGDAAQVQRRTIEDIAAFTGVAVSADDVDECVALCLAFLRKRQQKKPGFMDGWRGVFTDEDKAAFKDAFGPLLIELGYEQDHDW